MQPQYTDLVKKLKAGIAEWEKLLGPRWMHVEHVFIESYNDEDHSTLADTAASWQYHRATVRWFLPACATVPDSELDIAIAHEYVHVLLSPIESKLAKAHEELSEFAVESLARSMISIRKNTLKS